MVRTLMEKNLHIVRDIIKPMHKDLFTTIVVTAIVRTFILLSPLKTSITLVQSLLSPETGQLKTIILSPFNLSKDKQLTYSRYIF